MEKIPELDYLDWCRKNKGAQCIEDTYDREWIREFHKETGIKINGMQFAIMLGKYEKLKGC